MACKHEPSSVIERQLYRTCCIISIIQHYLGGGSDLTRLAAAYATLRKSLYLARSQKRTWINQVSLKFIVTQGFPGLVLF